MAFRPRMGTEVEFQEMQMTFVRQDATGFWPYDGKTKVEETMIKHDPILVPLNPGHASFANDVPWESDWGFVVVGDGFGHIGTKRSNGKDITFGHCVFEANSSAHFVDDTYHWIFLRAALKAFRDALLEHSPQANPNFANVQEFFQAQAGGAVRKWFPLADFVARYNAKIAALPLPQGAPVAFDRAKFQLELSPVIRALEAGTSDRSEGRWVAYLSVDNGLWADGQLNYQMNLESLYTNTNAWLDLWRHMWMEYQNVMREPVIDPISGHKKPVAGHVVYRNQILAAMWRSARTAADNFVNNHPLPVGTAPQLVNQFKALIMFTLTSTAPSPIEGGTIKNSYSQFPKTSPSSVSQLINIPTAGIAAIANDLVGARAALTDLRTLATLNAGGYLPAGSPVPGGFSTPYATTGDPILNQSNVHADFEHVWGITFKRTHNVAIGNNFGYWPIAPFKTWWSSGAHTAKPAVLHPGTNDIWVLFESRYGLNRLNLIFNPDVIEFPFYNGYLQLVEVTMGVAARNAAQVILNNQPAIAAQAANRGIVDIALANAQVAGIH